MPGEEKVAVLGERPKAIYVRFDYTRLATLGISALSIFDALKRQNMVTPAGVVEPRGPEIFIRIDHASANVHSFESRCHISEALTQHGDAEARERIARAQLSHLLS